MASTMPNTIYNPLSYVNRLDERNIDSIGMVVIHATELPDLATAREYGEKIHHEESRTGNSGHFYIDRDGSIEQWVPLERVAHHVRGHNANAIGIELVNRGRWPHWWHSEHQRWDEPYPEAQIEALIGLLQRLSEQLPALDSIAGHEQLDTDTMPASDDPDIEIRRKLDPGPTFPWERIEDSVKLSRQVGENL